jgi:hypothetical protein
VNGIRRLPHRRDNGAICFMRHTRLLWDSGGVAGPVPEQTTNCERRTAKCEPLTSLGDRPHGFAAALVGFLGRMARLQGDTLIGSEIG